MKKSKNSFTFINNMYIYCILLFVLVLINNMLTLPYIDDYRYAFIYPTFARINNVSDVVVSMKNHWFLHGGRIPAHTLASFFMWLGKGLSFDFCNSVIYILMIFSIAKLSDQNRNYSSSSIILAGSLYWLCNPHFADTVLWLTGACNYLWMPLLGVVSIDLIQKDYSDSSLVKKILVLTVMLLAGWGNENSSCAFLFCNFLYCIGKYIKKDLSRFNIFQIVFMSVGYLILILAPGNYERSGGSGTLIFGFIQSFPERFIFCTNLLIKNYWVLILLNVLTVFCFWMIKRKSLKECLPVLKCFFLYFSSAFICNYVMVASPFYPERASIGTMIMLIISFITVLNPIMKEIKVLRIVLASAMLMLFGLSYCFHTWIMISQYRYESDLITKINEERGKGGKDVVVSSNYHTESSKYTLNYNLEYTLSSDPSYWVNQYVAHYYGVDTISVRR